MIKRATILGLAAWSALCAPAAAQRVLETPAEPSGPVTFKAATGLNQRPGDFAPMLRGGAEADTRDWPASFWTTFDTPQGPSICTSALIGPEILLTAAHCVPASGKVSIEYKSSPTAQTVSYGADCTRHDAYPADPSADVALCRLSEPFKTPAGFKYETVEFAPLDAMLNKPVILAGYGCTSDVAAQNAIDGKYRYGYNTVKETSLGPPRAYPPSLYAPHETRNLFTDHGQANLCPGDSGGPVFRITQPGGGLKARTVVAVNSRVFYTDSTKKFYGESLLSALGGPDIRDWANTRAITKGLPACGLSGSLPNCR